ncbi:MAG TPA: ROK family protein [Bacteroidota bacterium]|nr:ROK family protein [Bacteroidota bacterium]
MEGPAAVTRKKKFAIGVDLGATTIKAGIVDRKGKILEQARSDTLADKGPDAVLKQMVGTIRDLLSRRAQTGCLGVGIGSPGVVTPDGVVRYPPNFAQWTEVNVVKRLRKTFRLPIFIENDANAAAMGEAMHGAAKKYKDFLFVIWGTGVGGGIILDRKIYRGPHGGAGEVGHVTIDYNGPQCNCGSRGCIESFIGQRYLSMRTREILESMPPGKPRSKITELVGGNLDAIEPVIISAAAEQGDPTAIAILQEAGELLGYALASALNILDLRTVVIGGGLSAAPDFVFTAVEAGLRSRVLKSIKPGVRVLRSTLGNAAGIVGAASLVW